jgi:hypothetical protein
MAPDMRGRRDALWAPCSLSYLRCTSAVLLGRPSIKVMQSKHAADAPEHRHTALNNICGPKYAFLNKILFWFFSFATISTLFQENL